MIPIQNLTDTELSLSIALSQTKLDALSAQVARDQLLGERVTGYLRGLMIEQETREAAKKIAPQAEATKGEGATGPV